MRDLSSASEKKTSGLWCATHPKDLSEIFGDLHDFWFRASPSWSLSDEYLACGLQHSHFICHHTLSHSSKSDVRAQCGNTSLEDKQ